MFGPRGRIGYSAVNCRRLRQVVKGAAALERAELRAAVRTPVAFCGAPCSVDREKEAPALAVPERMQALPG